MRKQKYLKNVDIRDKNEINKSLGIRMKEIDSLINELPFLTKNSLGDSANLDLNMITIMGHGFGATTAIISASKDTKRIQKVISLDPYLIPLKDEILNGELLVS